MDNWAGFGWKTFADLAVGELAYARLDGVQALLLKFSPEHGGIIEADSRIKGIWFTDDGVTPCIALGVDWFLDIGLDTEFYPNNPNAQNVNAVLFFGPTGFRMKFEPHNRVNDTIYAPLSGQEIAYRPDQHSAPILNWSIWQSRAHRLATKTAPLVLATG